MTTYAPELTGHDSLVGLPVFDCDGKRVGVVAESFVDARTAASAFVVIGMSPESELGREPFLVPARKLRVAYEGGRRSIVLHAALPDLERAVHWSELRWTDTVNARWADCLDRHITGQVHAAAKSPRSRCDATVGEESRLPKRRQAAVKWEIRSGSTPALRTAGFAE